MVPFYNLIFNYSTSFSNLLASIFPSSVSFPWPDLEIQTIILGHMLLGDWLDGS